VCVYMYACVCVCVCVYLPLIKKLKANWLKGMKGKDCWPLEIRARYTDIRKNHIVSPSKTEHSQNEPKKECGVSGSQGVAIALFSDMLRSTMFLVLCCHF